jgi:hypothetical protein
MRQVICRVGASHPFGFRFGCPVHCMSKGQKWRITAGMEVKKGALG